MKKQDKTNVMRLLDAAELAYTPHSYDVSDGQLDGVTAANRLGFPVDQVFKTLVTVGASRGLYVFVIPVAAELDLKKAAKAAQEKHIEMLPAKELLKNTGYIHGGCSPIGMKKLFRTTVDISAEKFETIYFSAGKIGHSVEVAPADLSRIIPVEFKDIADEAAAL